MSSFAKILLAAILAVTISGSHAGVVVQSGPRLITTGGGTPDILFDTFNYTLDRTQSGAGTAVSAFQNGPEVGGWANVKSENGGSPQSGSGWIYIVDEPTGFAGTLPNPAGRVLAVEARPPDIGGGFYQTDFYLQFGNTDDPLTYGGVPADMWMQFWIYSPATGSEATDNTSRDKFVYGNASISAGQEGGLMLFLGQEAYQTLHDAGWTTSSSNFFVGARPGYLSGPGTGANMSTYSAGDVDKLGFNLANKPIRGDHWTLVKIHLNVSGSQGSLEMWLREQGESSFTKVMEWIGGTTPNFTWNTSSNDRLGPSHFRMPTTVNAASTGYVKYKYFQDFAIATSESLLPVY